MQTNALSEEIEWLMTLRREEVEYTRVQLPEPSRGMSGTAMFHQALWLGEFGNRNGEPRAVTRRCKKSCQILRSLGVI